ncbi:uncharacterized protein C11orf52 homolog [Pipistrellus kuhlii]|uniref:Uncharacterized protein n=1 Tax=Pipistrellus kuhlii TaxID=59472 RepID=A0A7J7WZC5_PIPKU|nr:uncharacterized protein C11orf52 homolog [Pipistrellus kuhlii]KAF6342566.1 hypothetical protein mPipKuh1_001636 [Pipistrellus kuhlii]
MGNRLCCGGGRSCPSVFQRKKKMGGQPRWTLKQQRKKQSGTKGRVTTGQSRKQGLEQPASPQGRPGPRSEDSGLHYAVIQVSSHPQPRSAREVKHLQSENATEYATLCFPQATPCYDRKNGTLV